MELDTPLGTDEISECLIGGDIDGEVGIKIKEFLLRDIAFGCDGDQIEELLEDDILGLVP